MKWLSLIVVLPGLLAAQWVPFRFRGGEHFEYSLIYTKGDSTVKGRYLLDILKKDSLYELKISGSFGKSQGSLDLTLESLDDISSTLMAQAVTAPYLTPFFTGIFSVSLLMASMPSAFMGLPKSGEWTHSDEEGNVFKVTVKPGCKYGGINGKSISYYMNGSLKFTICIAEDVALPLYSKSIGDENEVYEVRLVNYKK